jgi:glutamine amidotransferase
MDIAIVRYNAGNIRSVLFALERIGATAEVTDEPEHLLRADRVIFPGVGEASSAMRYLRERRLDRMIVSLRQPVLGICLGMQLMCRHSEENDTECLGIFSEDVKRFRPEDPSVKVPQIGWNRVREGRGPLFEGIPDGSHFYFVHSYRACLGEDTAAVTDYAESYSSALCRGNFLGVQFHPEKSAAAGDKLLGNFLSMQR